MNNLRIIDADGHVQERDANWQELLDPPYRKHAPKMIAGPDGKEQLLLEGKIWAKPSRHRPRHRHRALQPQAAENHRHVRSDSAYERHGSRRHRHRGQLRHHGVSESAVSRKSRSRLRHRACLQHLARRLLQDQSEAFERRRAGRDAGAARKRSKSSNAASKNWALSPSRLPLIPRAAISIIPISILFTPKPRSSAFRSASTSVRAGRPRQPIASTTHFLFMPRRTPSNR